MGGSHRSATTARCLAAGTGSRRLLGLSHFARRPQRGDLLTNAEMKHQLVSTLQLPAEAELELKGLPAPHHQVLDVVCIRVVKAGVLALEKVNPSDLQIGPWKAVSRKGERKKKGGRSMVNCSAKMVFFFLMEPCESSKHLSVQCSSTRNHIEDHHN